MRLDHAQSKYNSWSTGAWQTAKSVLGFLTVVVGGYWLLRTGGGWPQGGRWGSEEAGALDITDISEGSPLTIGTYNVAPPDMEFLSVTSGFTNFPQPELFPPFTELSDAESELNGNEIILDTSRIKKSNIESARSSSRRLLASATLSDPIPDQIVDATIPYQYPLNNFSGNFSVLTATETGQMTLPAWLSLQYQNVGNYTVSGVSSVIVQDDLIFLAAGFAGLHILNASIPASPQWLSTYSSAAMRVAVSGNIAFVAGGYTGLSILNITNLRAPQLLTSYQPGNNYFSQSIAVSGDRLLLGFGNEVFLQILDVSNPKYPQLLGNYTSLSLIESIIISNTTVFLADYTAGILILNSSNPMNPQLLSSISTTGCIAGDLVLQGNQLLVACQATGFKIFDVSNLRQPRLLSSYPVPSKAGSVAASGNIAIITDFISGLLVLNISNSSAPQLLGGYADTGLSVAILGHIVFLGDPNGLQIINLNQAVLQGTPTAGLIAGQQFSITISACDSQLKSLYSDTFTLTMDLPPQTIITTLSDQSLFPGNSLTLHIDNNLLFTNPSNAFLLSSLQLMNGAPVPSWLSLSHIPTLLSSYPMTSFVGVIVTGDVAIVTNNSPGLWIFDISNPNHPLLLSSTSTNSPAGRVTMLNNGIVVIGEVSGLEFFNVTNSYNPRSISKINIGTVIGLTVQNNIIVATVGSPGVVYFVDANNVIAPQLLSSYLTLNTAWDVAAYNDTLILVADNSAVLALDIHNPISPQLVIDYSVTANAITVSGSRIFISSDYAGLKELDISNATYPQILGTYNLALITGFITLSGNLGTIIANPDSGSSISFFNPATLSQLSDYNTHGNVGQVALSGNLAIATSAGGLQLIKLSEWILSAHPASKDVGNYIVKYKVTDPLGSYSSQSFTVRVEGPPQIHGQIPLQYAIVGQVYNYFIPQGLFTDPNNDPISFTAFQTNQTNSLFLPSWLKFNSVAAALTGTPQISDQGTVNITISATDHIVGVTNTTFLLFVGDPIPQPLPFHAGRPLNFSVPDSTFAVGNGVTLQYSALESDGGLLPEWLAFNTQTLQFFGIPPVNITVAYNLNLQVIARNIRNDTLKAPLSFLIEPNSPLQINAISDQLATVGNGFNFFIPANTFVNLNGYPLVFSAALTGGREFPRWLSFNNSTVPPSFSGKPGPGDTNFYALRALSILLNASDGIVQGSTIFNINVGGYSWGQLAITIGMPLISALITMLGFYEYRAACLNRCQKKSYQHREGFEYAVGSEFTLSFNSFGFSAEDIDKIALKLPEKKARYCCQFFQLPRSLPGGALLPDWLVYKSTKNELQTKPFIPEDENGQRYEIQVLGKDEIILKQFPLHILPDEKNTLQRDIGSSKEVVTESKKDLEMQELTLKSGTTRLSSPSSTLASQSLVTQNKQKQPLTTNPDSEMEVRMQQ